MPPFNEMAQKFCRRAGVGWLRGGPGGLLQEELN